VPGLQQTALDGPQNAGLTETSAILQRGGADKLETPRLYTFEEIATLAANNPLPRGRCLVQVDNAGDLITAWLGELARRRHPRTG
jgi:hypothetical protein